MGEIVGHAPLILGLMLANMNNNQIMRNGDGPVAATAALQDRVTEAAYLRTLQSGKKKNPPKVFAPRLVNAMI